MGDSLYGGNPIGTDQQGFIKAMYTGNTNIFGQQTQLQQELGFNYRRVQPKTQLPADGKVGQIDFDVPTTLGHMAQNWLFCAEFRVQLADQATLTTELGGLSGNALQKKLENIEFFPDTIIGMLDRIELVHNSVKVQNLTRDKLRHIRRDTYNKDDYSVTLRQLNNNEWQRYYYMKVDSNENIEDASEHLGDMPSTYINASAGDGMYDSTNAKPYPSQVAMLQKREPGYPKNEMWERFMPEFFTEIGLKDWSSALLTSPPSTWAAANPGKTSGDYFAEKLADKAWDFTMTFDIPHPFHYNISHSLPILNLVNDPQLTFYFRPWQQWIQNYNSVKHLLGTNGLKIVPNSPHLKINYYDMAREEWDRSFPLDKPVHMHAPDFQRWSHDFSIKLREGETYPVDKMVNTIDKVSRYFIVDIQSIPHLTSNTTAFDQRVFSMLFSKLEFQVNDEKLFTKIEQTREHLRDNMKHQFFPKKCHPDDRFYFPLGIDGDIKNPGGGATNTRAFFNQLKISGVITGNDMKRFYNTQEYLFTNDPDLAAGTNVSSSHKSAVGGRYGLITRTGSSPNFVYEMNIKISVIATVIDIVSLEGGQLNKAQP